MSTRKKTLAYRLEYRYWPKPNGLSGLGVEPEVPTTEAGVSVEEFKKTLELLVLCAAAIRSYKEVRPLYFNRMRERMIETRPLALDPIKTPEKGMLVFDKMLRQLNSLFNNTRDAVLAAKFELEGKGKFPKLQEESTIESGENSWVNWVILGVIIKVSYVWAVVLPAQMLFQPEEGKYISFESIMGTDITYRRLTRADKDWLLQYYKGQELYWIGKMPDILGREIPGLFKPDKNKEKDQNKILAVAAGLLAMYLIGG